jgi:methylmalonyl-CoA mutase, C-terminal domain
VVAKLGMDAHWRGAIVVANGLRDAGMEVVYLGHASSAEIANTVVQEDAMLVGLSCLSGNHLAECPPVMQALRDAGMRDVVVALGGVIPPADWPALEAAGIDAIFATGTPLPAIIERLAALIATRATNRVTEDT